MRTVFILFGILLLCSSPLFAQRGGGERGSGREGGERGGFGSRGGERGGFSSRGGDRGGFSSRGGSSRGGFDPSAMIRRFDRNGNNMIDPDEAQGTARFFLQRMAQNNPNIDLSKPVPIDQLGAEMSRMRGGGSRDSSGSSSTTNEPELLVPDFSSEVAPMPPPGFGAASDLFTVPVEDRDKKEAEERLRRYDRNRDGKLSKEELARGRWSDDPMQYDRNRDGQLSVSELAVRYANRRVAQSERRSESGSRDRGSWMSSRTNGWSRSGSRGSESAKEKEEDQKVDRFGDAKSYLSSGSSAASIKGLPAFLASIDANSDGQVMAHEFSSSWDGETLARFQQWDLNRDGIIVPQECIAAIESGVRVDGGSSSGGSSKTSKSPGPSSGSGEIDDADMTWAKRLVAKYDTNGDNELTSKEWEKMYVNVDSADTNGDGIITIEEYAIFRTKKK